jgi:hypothetical protein
MPLSLHRLAGRAMILLALLALVTVISGYFQKPQPDEGTGAHIFQLSVVALMILIPLFAATANWAEPKKQITPLAITGSALILAFGALYYLEHVYWASGH